MSADLRELYQTVILDHYRKPRNYGRPEGTNRWAEGKNPLCGDHVKVYARTEGDRLAAVGFEGTGCAISTASASLMTQAVQGKSAGEARAIFTRFRDVVTGGADAAPEELAALGKLEVLAGVREFPARVKCATLSWHALEAALDRRAEAVSTE